MEALVEFKETKTKTHLSPEVINTIYDRRSVRKYKDIPVEKKSIEKIVDAGRMAPSALNKQPWKFYVLSKKDDIEAFSKQTATAAVSSMAKSGIKNIMEAASDLLNFSNGMDFFNSRDHIFHSAPVVIFITSLRDDGSALDIGMCSQNMMLAAKALGIDSCPVGLGKYVEQTTIFSKLNVPKSEQVHLAIVFGYGNESPVTLERIKTNAVYI
jgi:nitroreductase